MMLATACKKEDTGDPVKDKMVLVKIFDEGALNLHIFYSTDYAIDSIRFFNDAGEPWHTDVFERNASGKIENVYGKYFSPRDAASFHEEKIEIIYTGGKKTKATRYHRFITNPNDSTWRKDEEYTYEYPHPQNIIVKEFTSRGELKLTREYFLDKAGNILKQNYIVAPMFLPYGTSYYWEWTYDQSISPWHLIDEKLPGYFKLPQNTHNFLTRKSLTETGELKTTITYKNEFNAEGYLIKQTAFEEDGAVWDSYRFEYEPY